MAWLPGRTLGSALDKTAKLPNGMTIEDYENSTGVTLTGVWLEFTGERDEPVGIDLGLIAGYCPGGNGGTTIKAVLGRGVWVKDSPKDVKDKIEQARQLLDKNAKEFYPAQHEFQGRSDRDCELCGKPDRHPNHNPEGKFNG